MPLTLAVIGEENIMEFMNKSSAVQPIITSAIGLIPNCSSSIILAESYIKGIIGFSGLIAGLASNAGIGIIILLRNRKNLKKAAFVMVSLYVSAVVLGYITALFV